jgi:hypothetical protein
VRSWSRRRIVVTLCGVLAGLWLTWCVVLVIGAARSLSDGSQQLQSVRRDATLSTLVEPEIPGEIDQAGDAFSAAVDDLGHPALAPVRVLPVLGRHLRAAESLARAGRDGSAIAAKAVDDLAAVADRPQGSGIERLATLDELASIGRRAGDELEALEVGEGDGLFGPLGRAVEEVAQQRRDALGGAEHMSEGSAALRSVLAGPEPYLLVGANNAEMRAGGGMALSAAELRFEDGQIELGDVRATSELVLAEGAVPVDNDLATNWPWIDVGRDLRNLGLSADFPQSGEVAVANWAEVPDGGPVGGVIAIDVDGLRSLLRAVGPVEVDGVRYSADTVRGELLRDQYRRFSGDQAARRDQLGSVARAVFAEIEAGRWELASLATELSDAVAGRHLMIWSSDEQLASVWRDLDADGHLQDRSVSVALVNRSATKLDSWIESTVAIERGEPAEDGRRPLTVQATFVNTAPAEGPSYLVGPNVEGLRAGDHRALALVNLPAGSQDVVMRGARVFLEGGDGPTVVVGGELDIARGATVTVTVTASLPPEVETLVLEPTARIPRTDWEVDGRSYDRDRRRSVAMGAS